MCEEGKVEECLYFGNACIIMLLVRTVFKREVLDEMLNVYLDDKKVPSGKKIIDDVEKEFRTCVLQISQEEQTLIEAIDGGHLDSRATYIDRFGTQLSISELSTGCKAGLCVLHYKESIVSLRECGYNAVESILRFCRVGSVLVPFDTTGFLVSEDNALVEILCNEYYFTNYSSFNFYVKDW